MRYCPKNSIVNVEIKNGKMYATDSVGETKEILNEKFFNTQYISIVEVEEVEVVEFSESDWAKGYEEMGEIIRKENEQNENNEDYIW